MLLNKFSNLSKFKFLKVFMKNKKKFGGRNHHGVITVRHQGGGHSQRYRFLDWMRLDTQNTVINFEYDPNRNVFVAKLYNTQYTNITKCFSYILAPKGLQTFDTIKKIIIKKKNLFLKEGDCTILCNYEVGDFVHNVEFLPEKGAHFARAAGTFCQIMQPSNYGFVKLRIPSGLHRFFYENIFATKGVVSNEKFNLVRIDKAGRSRWINRRPSVRGVAMNPVDHPHGGGQGKTKGGRPSVTPRSLPTKGQPTRNKRKKNKFVVHF